MNRRAVHHVLGAEDPGGRLIQDVALEDLDADRAGQQEDDPRERLARPCAHMVDEEEKALHAS